MHERMQYSLRAIFFAITVWALLLATRGALPLLVLFLLLSINLILGPFRLVLDAVDRFALRFKRERWD